MSTSADRLDDRNPEDHTISVTSLGEAEQVQAEPVPAGHARDEQSQDEQFREQPYSNEQFRAEEVPDGDAGPLADDGQPIFPPEPSDSAFAPAADQEQAPELSQAQSQEQSQVTDAGYDRGDHRGDDRLDDRLDDQEDVVAAAPAGAVSDPVSEPAHKTTSDDDAWLALQGKFVDDPAAAVQEAADRVEQQLADVRSGLSSADTEGLRTAFRRYRELSDSLR